MAANLQNLKLAGLGKRFVSRIGSRDSLIAFSSSSSRRGVHDSVYDKNQEEHMQERILSTIVPDDVIQPQPEKYWGPHPETGVFGPATDKKYGLEATNNNTDSVLDQKAFFRPLADLDKPDVHP